MRISDWSSDVCSSDLHVIDKQICRSADQCAATGQHSDIRQRHQIALRGLFKSQCDVTHDWRAKHDDRRRIEETGNPSDHREQQPDASGTHSPAEVDPQGNRTVEQRSEEHTSELQSLMRISYAVFCLKNKTTL